MFIKLIFIFLFLVCYSTYSKFSLKPVSYDSTLTHLTHLNDLNVEITEIPNIDSLLSWENKMIEIGVNLPELYGYSYPVNFTLKNSGSWDTLVNGDRLWRLRIQCPGSYSINLVFNNFKIGNNSHISFYNVDKNFLLGPFNFDINKNHGVYSSHLIEGDDIIIELFEPFNNTFNSEFSIKKVIYGYKDVEFDSDIYLEYKSNENEFQSASCHRDVNCSEGDDWCKQKYSVAVVISPLQMGGSGGAENRNWHWCSGSLINNVRNDYFPYFYCALHCLRSFQGNHTDEEILNEWSFKFRYIREACGAYGSFPTYVYSGADFVAGWDDTDFLLVSLQTQPQSGENNFPDVYFNGWDRTGDIPGEVTCLHHPDGDLMKISQKYSSPFFDNFFWYVDWDLGTTEGGSSGSPLFSNNFKVVGSASAMTYWYNPCHPDATSRYGRLDISWEGGGTPQTRLRDWLDPDNTGVETLDGIKMPYLMYGNHILNGQTENWNAYSVFKIGSNQYAPFVVYSGANLTLKAGKEIVIRPCTKVVEGSTFRAYIEELSCSDTIHWLSDKESQYGGDVCGTYPPKASAQTESINFVKSNLLSIHPNPFGDVTRISVNLTEPSEIRLEVFDLLGNRVAIIASGEHFNIGIHDFTFSGHRYHAGIYYLILTTNTERISRPLLLMK